MKIADTSFNRKTPIPYSPSYKRATSENFSFVHSIELTEFQNQELSKCCKNYFTRYINIFKTTKQFTLPIICCLSNTRFFQKNPHQIDFLNPLSANPTKWSNTLKLSGLGLTSSMWLDRWDINPICKISFISFTFRA